MQKARRLDPAGRDAVLEAMSDALARWPDVSFAYAFGSFLREDTFRDVDVAVWMSRDAGRVADMEIAADLSCLVRLPVDVRRVNEAPTTFLYHALRGRPLVVRDERLLADLMERTARRYHDLQPVLRRATREAFTA